MTIYLVICDYRNTDDDYYAYTKLSDAMCKAEAIVKATDNEIGTEHKYSTDCDGSDSWHLSVQWEDYGGVTVRAISLDGTTQSVS